VTLQVYTKWYPAVDKETTKAKKEHVHAIDANWKSSQGKLGDFLAWFEQKCKERNTLEEQVLSNKSMTS